eukprot:TRINITY_DN1885_c0_g1_i1.p1 TRINITY_DN1885_c0_g1~~TRINITY_DN1885_c0_g1_i1.p1  ORF type:complete len:586 (-),score=60.04 TRINITY_DN1885_c0_g1_i1:39-1796(-)
MRQTGIPVGFAGAQSVPTPAYPATVPSVPTPAYPSSVPIIRQSLPGRQPSGQHCGGSMLISPSASLAAPSAVSWQQSPPSEGILPGQATSSCHSLHSRSPSRIVPGQATPSRYLLRPTSPSRMVEVSGIQGSPMELQLPPGGGRLARISSASIPNMSPSHSTSGSVIIGAAQLPDQVVLNVGTPSSQQRNSRLSTPLRGFNPGTPITQQRSSTVSSPCAFGLRDTSPNQMQQHFAQISPNGTQLFVEPMFFESRLSTPTPAISPMSPTSTTSFRLPSEGQRPTMLNNRFGVSVGDGATPSASVPEDVAEATAEDENDTISSLEVMRETILRVGQRMGKHCGMETISKAFEENGFDSVEALAALDPSSAAQTLNVPLRFLLVLKEELRGITPLPKEQQQPELQRTLSASDRSPSPAKGRVGEESLASKGAAVGTVAGVTTDVTQPQSTENENGIPASGGGKKKSGAVSRHLERYQRAREQRASDTQGLRISNNRSDQWDDPWYHTSEFSRPRRAVIPSAGKAEGSTDKLPTRLQGSRKGLAPSTKSSSPSRKAPTTTATVSGMGGARLSGDVLSRHRLMANATLAR